MELYKFPLVISYLPNSLSSTQPCIYVYAFEGDFSSSSLYRLVSVNTDLPLSDSSADGITSGTEVILGLWWVYTFPGHSGVHGWWAYYQWFGWTWILSSPCVDRITSSNWFNGVALKHRPTSGSTVGFSDSRPITRYMAGLVPAGFLENCHLLTREGPCGEEWPWAMAERVWNQPLEIIPGSPPEFEFGRPGFGHKNRLVSCQVLGSLGCPRVWLEGLELNRKALSVSPQVQTWACPTCRSFFQNQFWFLLSKS